MVLAFEALWLAKFMDCRSRFSSLKYFEVVGCVARGLSGSSGLTILRFGFQIGVRSPEC